MIQVQEFDYIIGIIDGYDAVHSQIIPWNAGNNRDYDLMHGDLYAPTHRRWRVKIEEGFDNELICTFCNFGVNLNDDDYMLIRNHLHNVYGFNY